MLTKEKALYQVKLILSYLPEEEFKKIPKDTINYIEDNYEYDEKIKIDPNIPLENQNIDEKACNLLEDILETIEKTETSNEFEDELLEKNLFNDDKYNIKMSSITWEKILKDINNEKEKNKRAKDLLKEYIKIVKSKDIEIDNLKKKNQELYEIIKKIPNFIRKLFIKKDIIKLLSK